MSDSDRVLIGQVILGFIAILGFAVQIWRGYQIEAQERLRLEQQTEEINGRIELARLELATRSAATHQAADKAFREANAVNEKIHAVGTGIIHLVQASDPQEADQLTQALEKAQEIANKRNGDPPT